MFTGLIQSLGQLQTLSSDRMAIAIPKTSATTLLTHLEQGDSVAVDGICLTVETILSEGFVATTSPETLQRTTLSSPEQTAAYVNLEASLQVGGKVGGHFVTGHVDGIGCLVASQVTGAAWEMEFAPPPELATQWQQAIARYIVPKGSIAVNGISLTVADCDPQGRWFKVAVIPHTYAETNLHQLQPGHWVNLEGDILGKYVEKLLQFGTPDPTQTLGDIDASFLSEHGYG